MEKKVSTITYFLQPGKENTEEVLQAVGERARELGIKTIFVASITGETGLRVIERFPEYKVVVVSLLESPDVRSKIESRGGSYLVAPLMPHVESLMNYFDAFSPGTKVAYAMAVVAAQNGNGFIEFGEEVIAMGVPAAALTLPW